MALRDGEGIDMEMVDRRIYWAIQFSNVMSQMRSSCIGDVCQGGSIHMTETFTEETQLLGSVVGKIVGEGSGDVLILGTLKGGTPPASDGDAKLDA